MKRDYPDRPIVGVGAVIVRDGRAVVVRRSAEPAKGQWSIPGGMLELGETLRQGAAREALEETGLKVEAGEVLEVFDSIYSDSQGKTRYHYVLIDFLCRPMGGELRPGSDAAEVRWVTLAEMEALDITATAREVIRRGIEQGSFNVRAD
jgi:ADP-ribose pyrophosphatase YjhB (NUDIX family)